MLTNARPAFDRLGQALVIGFSLLLVASLLSLGLLVVAVQQRLVEPPHFALHLGPIYLSAPCPAPTLVCDVHQNYYAVWRGYDLPGGGIHYEQVYFTYLKKKH